MEHFEIIRAGIADVAVNTSKIIEEYAPDDVFNADKTSHYHRAPCQNTQTCRRKKI